MNRAIIQVPVSPKLRKEAEEEAEKQGFSSLQDAVRIFLKKLAQKEIRVKFEETVYLSPKAEKRYERIDRDFKKGKNIYAAKDPEELMTQLNENPLS